MLSILLVDDEKQEREGIRFLIEKFGFPLEIYEAPNGKIALEHIKMNRVDILFTDVKMPYMDGLELAKCVNEYDSSIAIIIFSAYSEFEYAKKACEANAVNYLLKPIEVDEFEAVMKKTIDLCTKRQKLRLEKNFLENADKKLLLYRMMNSEGSIWEILKRLQKYDIILDNKYLLFLSVETGTEYFEKREEQFLSILQNRIGMHYEYINIYPNHAYILLYKSSRPTTYEIEGCVKKIYNDMLQDQVELVSIIVGECFQGTEKLSEKIHKIEDLKEETFSCFSGIQYSENISMEQQGRIAQAIQMKDRIFTSIKNKDLQEVKMLIRDYINQLETEKTASAFYTKYIVLDIVKALYAEFGIYNQNMIYQTSDKIVKCNSLKEMRDILTLTLDQIEETAGGITEDGSSTVRKIQAIISNEYMEDLSLNELAERVYLTPAYISYIFKKETGQNLVKYLMDFRLAKAKALLAEGEMKIVDIGKACGYPNQSYFNRIFKNNFGVTPKQFRENKDV